MRKRPNLVIINRILSEGGTAGYHYDLMMVHWIQYLEKRYIVNKIIFITIGGVVGLIIGWTFK